MSSSDQGPTLPPGETDPNRLYIAVGRAIHAWESMEEALAHLYATLASLPEDPGALSDYGAENKIFIDRIAAVKAAANRYFVRLPNQINEGELLDILGTAQNLSIKRHRVAHGHITMWASAPPPTTPGPFSIQFEIHYRWAAPWYSTTTLRTDPVGGDAASIEIVLKEFEALHNRISKLTSDLPKRP